MARPLAGIRVIELANFIAGPLAGTLLADMGADVIKVEPPQGDMGRATPPLRNGESVSFAALNRNKRSLVLDLKRPQAGEILRRLAAGSDVFLEAYRPGALDKLGLGAAELKAINPRIVYTSVSGFGQSGPDRRRAGVNLIIEAFSGVLSVTGEPGRMPMRPGVQTADVFGALFATYATLAGLVGAARNGEGRIADLSLVEASIAAAAWEAAEYLETGNVPQPLGNRHRLAAPYQLFETRDGRYLAIGTPNDQLFARLMQVLELAGHLGDARFASYASRKANEDALAPAGRARRARPRLQRRRGGAAGRGRAVRAREQLRGGVRRSADRRARRRAGGRASAARPDAHHPQSGSARSRRARHRAPLADAGRAFAGDPDRARLPGGGDRGHDRRRGDPHRRGGEGIDRGGRVVRSIHRGRIPDRRGAPMRGPIASGLPGAW